MCSLGTVLVCLYYGSETVRLKQVLRISLMAPFVAIPKPQPHLFMAHTDLCQ